MKNYEGMPELTDEEVSHMGNHTLSYYDKNVSGYVQEKASEEKFYTLVGAVGDGKSMLKELLHSEGELEVHTTTYGVVKIKLLGA